MYPTIVDIETGRVETFHHSHGTLFFWAEGNGSCDCFRGILMGESEAIDKPYCDGTKRYVIADVHECFDGDDKKDILAQVNQHYPAEAIEAAMKIANEHDSAAAGGSESTKDRE